MTAPATGQARGSRKLLQPIAASGWPPAPSAARTCDDGLRRQAVRPSQRYYDSFSQMSDQTARSLLLGIRLANIHQDRDGCQPGAAVERLYPGTDEYKQYLSSNDDRAAPEQAAPMGNSGETLRKAREDKGLTLSAVAQQLNLTERALARIEAGDFSQLPGHTFARGYVRAYAKLLVWIRPARFQSSTSTPAPTHPAAASTVSAVSRSPAVCRAVSCVSSASPCCWLWRQRRGSGGRNIRRGKPAQRRFRHRRIEVRKRRRHHRDSSARSGRRSGRGASRRSGWAATCRRFGCERGGRNARKHTGSYRLERDGGSAPAVAAVAASRDQ